jgi:hypothetical protein
MPAIDRDTPQSGRKNSIALRGVREQLGAISIRWDAIFSTADEF